MKVIYQGSPADRSGVITEGDTLLEVNGETVRGLSLQRVAPLITGPLDTPLQLGYKLGKEALEAGYKSLATAQLFSQPDLNRHVFFLPPCTSHLSRLESLSIDRFESEESSLGKFWYTSFSAESTDHRCPHSPVVTQVASHLTSSTRWT